MQKKVFHNRVIAIVGPTASGKSDLAVHIAKQVDGEIISVDSRQVYKGLDIGSGKITKREMRGIPHYMLDVADPSRTYTVAQYQKRARKILKQIIERGKTPILCGGTGFYLQSIIDGIVIPDVKPNKVLREALKLKTTQELFRMVQRLDMKRAKTIDSKNPQRLIRALEIIHTIGSVPKIKTHPLHYPTLILGIRSAKKDLASRIHIRLIKRIRMGLLKEINNLHIKKGIPWKRLESLGLEYRYGALFLQKKISKQEFVEDLERAIRQYAKRQITWFKKDKRIHWIKNPHEAMRIINIFLK